MSNEPVESTINVHEWECLRCRYHLRLQMAPLCAHGGICNICSEPVNYNGIKDVPERLLGVTYIEEVTNATT